MNHIDFPICGFDGNLIEKLSNSGFEACLHRVFHSKIVEKKKKEEKNPNQTQQRGFFFVVGQKRR